MSACRSVWCSAQLQKGSGKMISHILILFSWNFYHLNESLIWKYLNISVIITSRVVTSASTGKLEQTHKENKKNFTVHLKMKHVLIFMIALAFIHVVDLTKTMNNLTQNEADRNRPSFIDILSDASVTDIREQSTKNHQNEFYHSLCVLSMFKIVNRTLEATESTSQLTLAYITSEPQLNSRIVAMDRGRYNDQLQFSPKSKEPIHVVKAVDNDLPTNKYLRCKSLPEMEEIKLCDNNNGSIRLFRRKLRSANEIQIASIRISLCETKLYLVTTTIWSHPRPPPTSVPRPEGHLIQWGGNNLVLIDFLWVTFVSSAENGQILILSGNIIEVMDISYTAMHTEINENERQAQSIISNILAFHVRENETRGISLAQFELRSVRIGKLENSLIDHLLIPHYPGCHACKSKFPLPSPTPSAHHRDVVAQKWRKIQLEDQAKISYYYFRNDYENKTTKIRHAFSKDLVFSLHKKFSSTSVHTDIKGTDEFHLRISELHFSAAASWLEDGIAFLHRVLV
ncbi:hypothetical protein G5I_02760 [Acromyrmex echinatior]|uniref:Uncharacterized protein n=1 Tax=Acromyrmex echinatior TaxID=103372 RepID=F4WB59_ACREC|nr:hypothetical protein G5I_02760 [Acromyrmex echinatior]